MGRPRIEIDWAEFDKLCAIQATLEEIAGWFNCSEDTIERRVKETQGVTFAEYFKQKSAVGKISLRRSQFQLAKTNTAMGIWLGKQWLGQTDKIESKNTTHTTYELSPETEKQDIELLKKLTEK